MKILIIRFSSFGDIVLTTPLIRKIKEKYPEAEIDFLVYNNFLEAISSNPYLRNIIIFDKKNKKKEYINEIIKKLKMENYDYVFDLHSKILSKLIGKKVVKGEKGKFFTYKKRKWWKTLLVKMRLIPYNADCTIVESYFTVMKKTDLKISFTRENIEKGLGDNLEFYIDDSIQKKILEKYNLINEKYFVLAPGASKFTKKWPYYTELAKKLIEKTNDKIYVIGGKEDFELVANIDKKRIINLCGQLSFKESAVILKYANIVIANDSGPFHMARALKKETFVFFGPTDPKLFSFEKNTYLFYNEKCRPYSLYGEDKFPKKYKECMTGICVEKVVDKIMEIYNKK